MQASIQAKEIKPKPLSIAYQLLDNTLDKVGESQLLVALLRVPDVLGKLSDGLGISLALEGVALLLKDELELTVVGNDSVMHDCELVLGVRAMGVGVNGRGLTVSGPTSVGHTAVGGEGLVPVNAGLGLDQLLELSNLSDLLEDQDLLVAVAIDGKT